MKGELDANDWALLRSWTSEEGVRPQSDPDLRLEQLLSVRDVFARSLRGIETELHSHINVRKVQGRRPTGD